MPSLTREAAVDYYRRVARWMLPHVGNVPVSFKRYTDGAPVDDAGSYDVIAGSVERGRMELWFGGTSLSGAWALERMGDDTRRWTLRSSST